MDDNGAKEKLQGMIGAKESSHPSFLGRERGPDFLETRKKCLTCHFLQDTRLERGCGVYPADVMADIWSRYQIEPISEALS